MNDRTRWRISSNSGAKVKSMAVAAILPGPPRHTGAVDNLVRDAIEVALVVAVGGLLWSAVGRLRRGEVRVYRCAACARPTSRAYPRCRHCDVEQPDAL